VKEKDPAIEIIDPNASVYEKFKYKIGVAKYQALHKRNSAV
jgi:hypothetical protein